MLALLFRQKELRDFDNVTRMVSRLISARVIARQNLHTFGFTRGAFCCILRGMTEKYI